MLNAGMFPFSLDLQLFAEGEPAVEAVEIAAEAPADNPILAELESRSGQNTTDTEVEPQQQVVEEAPAAPTFDEVAKQHGLTFKDPEALIQAHKSLQAEYTRKSQEAKRVAAERDRQMAEFNATLAELQAQAKPGDAVAEETKDAIFNDPDLLDKFYNNPAEVLKEVATLISLQQTNEAVAPLKQKLEALEAERAEAQLAADINGAIESFSQTHPDYAQYEDAMGQFINGLPASIGQEMSFTEMMEFAYEHVRGQEALKATAEPSFDEKLKDAEFLKQLADNPAIRDAVLQSHLAGVVKSTEGLPPVLGPKSGGAMPASEPRQFRTFEDSKRSLLSALGSQ